MSFSEWKKYKLGDLIKINEKSISKTNSFDQIRYFDTSSVTENKFDEPEILNLSDAPSRAKRLVKKEDIIYSTVRPIQKHFGIFKAVEENTVVSTGFAVISSKKINPYFLFYYLSQKSIIEFLNAVAESSTTTFPAFNPSLLESLEINLPSKETQQRIGSILSSLDDKIELNRQTNQTLEALAQALFKEMCLPKGDVLEDGWRVGKLGEFYKTTSGGTPSRSKMEYYENGTINWVKSKELGDFFVLDTEEKITVTALNNSSAKFLPINSILLAMYGATVGEISILGKPATSNQAICSILPNEDYPFSFIYEFLKSQKDVLKNMAVGGAQQNISQTVVQSIGIVMPSPETLKEFHLGVNSIYNLVKSNIEEINTLTSLRDSLLHRLMKGEIEI